MRLLQALQAVNACNVVSTHAQEAQDGLLRTISYVRDLKLGTESDLAYDEFYAIERDMCDIYVRLGMIRSEAANGGCLEPKEGACHTTQLSKFEASNE